MDRARSFGSARRPRRCSRQSIPKSRSSSITTEPAAASRDICKARSTSSTRRGPPSPTRNQRPRPRASSGRDSWSDTTGSHWSSIPRTTSSNRSASSSSRQSGHPEARSRHGKMSMPSWPERKHRVLFAGQRFGNFRVFHRSDCRQGEESARRCPDRAPTTTRWSTESPVILMASAISAMPTSPPIQTSSALARAEWRRREAGAAEPRDDR